MSQEEYYNDQAYFKAKRKVLAKKRFYKHLAAFMIINGFLLCINLITDPYYYWFVFPALSWGVGLLFHYISVFGLPGINFNDPEWEEKQIQKELRKQRPKSNPSFPTEPENELELKDFKNLRKEWRDSDFV